MRRDEIERRLTDSIETVLRLAEGVAEIVSVPQGMADSNQANQTSQAATPRGSPSASTWRRCGCAFEELAPRNFCINSLNGVCATCNGVGTKSEVDLSRRV